MWTWRKAIGGVAIFGHTGVGLVISRHRYCHKSVDDTEELNTQRSASARLCWRDPQPSFSSIAVTIDQVLKSLVVQRAAFLWVFTICSILFLEKGFHGEGGGHSPVAAVLECCRQSLSPCTNISSYESESKILSMRDSRTRHWRCPPPST